MKRRRTCAQTLANAQELGIDRFEVSAHLGTRPEHAAWQGKVYTADELVSVCGLGSATGLCGINCRHSYYPYLGGDAHYAKGELDEMREDSIEVDGEKITRYEAEQKQRALERAVRKYKLKADVLKEAGLDNTAARTMLAQKQRAAAEWCKKTGLRRDYAREFIGTKSGTQPRGRFAVLGLSDNAIKAKDIKRLDDAINKEIANVKQGKPMNFRQANGGACNPHFNESEDYNNNCQSCAAAYEMRRRGFDVEAKPKTKGSMADVLSYKTNIVWVDRTTGKAPEYIYPRCDTLNEAIKWMKNNLKTDNRFTIEWEWEKRGGHIIHCYKNRKGNVSFYDPQSGANNRDSAAIKKYFEKARIKTFKLLDVQNCDINMSVANQIVKERSK